ncbi:thiol-driven fumarate reductase, iron-sulfur protein (HdrD-like) [Methanocella conradii HZ254]|uniref:Thiol-driven fumarate reductase, iron-sulfur protein (HdrD-like) n=1 Tax=Methanocella conradii (strain DSM 24694 / JCM 17849 / CGMCC 1.5162 / HZ254) TaxID=1041930 RepID=H8I744_METCZ|nr:(Fe-S)-binding protein [Methanocella conradii]AFD00295.1 thiol-driven fumarate reductase, iron-sulfur protein (HdrD-like) [Methanocella conradii HZ254]
MIQDYIGDIIKCTRCGRCSALCPVHEELEWESTNARGRMLLARALAEGEAPSESMKRSFYTCLTCSMCSSTCPSGAKPDLVMEAARKELIRLGCQPGYYDGILDNISRHGNSLGEPGPRNAWVPEELKLNGKADVIYWAGCLASYRQRSVALASLKVLSRFGARVLEDERCCGSPLLRLGGEPVTLEHNVEQIRKSGASTLVTGCAGCYKTLKESICDVEVLHFTQFLARHVDELKLERLPYKVTYHDPCHLGRCMGVYDEPRSIIKRICDFEEMASHGKEARCCGGGGGVRRGYGDLARAIAKKRLSEAPHDVDYIITACPMCRASLQEAGGRVLDISELVLMSLI